MSSRRILSLFGTAILLTGIWIPGGFAFASYGCVCTTDGDCKSITNLSVSSKESCADACQDGKSDFALDIAGAALISECSTTHTQYVSDQNKSASPQTPKTPTITPTLNVDIPGLKFTDAVSGPCTQTGGNANAKCVQSTFLASYITAVINFLLGSGIVAVVVLVMIGGFQYVLGAASKDQAAKGKKRIQNAVTGLLLLLCCYVILATVNPQLVSLKMVEVQTVPPETMPVVDAGDISDDSSTSVDNLPAPKRLCHSIEECKKICDAPYPENIKAASNIPKLENAPGFVNAGGATGTNSLQQFLHKAGQIAQQKNSNYSIRMLGSKTGYRSIKSQLDKACANIKDHGGASLTDGTLAWPGGSNHGSGVAADVVLYDGDKSLTTTSSKTQSSPKFEEPAKILSEIMTEAGFVRYTKEIWHFEIKGKGGSSCRCSFPNCPFPPKC